MERDPNKVVLAYSGGLDTACILKTLIDRGHAVVAFVADVGQQEDFGQVTERAKQTGASKVVVRDLRREFVTQFIFPAIAGNAVYENRYLLGTSLARPVIAKGQVEVAQLVKSGRCRLAARRIARTGEELAQLLRQRGLLVFLAG